MRLNAIVDERHAPIVFEGEGSRDYRRDLDCVAAESNPLYARLEAFDLDKAGVSFSFTSPVLADRSVSPVSRRLPASRNSFDQL